MDKPKSFVDLYQRANPLPGARAKVPVLEVQLEDEEGGEDLVLCESLVVAEFIAELNQGLFPPTPEDRAVMRLFIELCGSNFGFFPMLLAKDDPEKFEGALQKFKNALVETNTFLSSMGSRGAEGPFLFGKHFTLAECAVAPFIQRACTVLPALLRGKDENGSVDPIDICEELNLGRLREWMEAVLARSSVVTTGVRPENMIESAQNMLERFKSMAKED